MNVRAPSVEPMPDLTREDEAELASHRFYSEAGRVTANVLARCVRYTEKCDEQMTARMQRKNRQVRQISRMLQGHQCRGFCVGLGKPCLLLLLVLTLGQQSLLHEVFAFLLL